MPDSATPETARHVGRFERLVTVELTNAEIDAAKTGAARRLSRDLKIPGFRPGKAPRPVVEAAIGAGRLRTEAVEDLIPKKLSDVLSQENLNPAVTPSLEKIDDIDGGVAAEVLVTLWPALDAVPNYRHRRIEVTTSDIEEEEVEASLARMRQQFASLETADRAAGEGDFVSIDISATADDQTVEETTANELLYEVGSGLLVEGIDERLLGTAAGTELSFESTLPDGFGTRAGEPVKFHVKVNEVKSKVLPDLDDDWVGEVTEFDTVEELRAELAERLAVTKRRAVANEFREKALDTLVTEAPVELPDRLIRAEIDDLYHRFAHRLEESDITVSDYLGATGLSEQQFVDDLQAQAERSIRTRLVLDAVAREEGLEVSPEELAATIEALARSTEDPKAVYKAFESGSRALSLAGDILRNKALDAVVAKAQPVDSEGNPVKLEMAEEEESEEPELPQEEVVEAEVVEAEIVEAEFVEAEIVGEEA
jgi:trigger factor